jgi:two-component system sensor histidine kinase RegB
MAHPTTFEIESPAWLRNLRWTVIAGIAAAVAGARILGAEFPSNTIFMILGAFAFWNLILPLIEHQFSASSRAIIFLQVMVDILLITTVLWHSGGLTNPFVGFYIVNVLVAGLLLSPTLTVLTSAFATGCVWILLSAPPILLRGEPALLKSSPIWFGIPVGIVVLIILTTLFILVFLSRLKKAQELLRQRIKMDALGRLVAGLAHEIGTPLNSILVIAKNIEDEVPDVYKKDLGIIASQAKRCGEIVSLLLGYSQTMVRRSEEVKYTPVQIKDWIQETYDWQVDAESKKYPDQKRKSVTFRIDTSQVPETIHVPQLILRQVIENLFKNARDAIKNEPQPEISATVTRNDAEREWGFVISDNGPGFSKEEADKAFEAFFTTKKQGFGSGLGLYISYYLLDQVGGRIVIDEHSSRGATMRVTLPELDGHDDQDDPPGPLKGGY